MNSSVEQLEELRISIFGKKGVLAAEFSKMKDIPNDEKGTFGPPKYKAVEFDVDKNTTITLKIK